MIAGLLGLQDKKVIYCSRTHKQLEFILKEFKKTNYSQPEYTYPNKNRKNPLVNKSCLIFGSKKKCIHDMVGGTQVVDV